MRGEALSLSGLPFPFTAVVGQERMKMALVINAVNPSVGGVLIKGERGTGKSTAVRALADLLPEIEVSGGCRFSCDPGEASRMCEECAGRLAEEGGLETVQRKVRLVDLPLNASEDRVVGTIDIEAAIQRGEKHFEPGLLARANRSILYIDEVNLLDDHIVDILLDAAAMGVNVVEREGVSYAHPATFIMIGTMNPEEGELRPQLEDRFGLCVEVRGERDCDARAEVIRRRLSFLNDPESLREAFREEQEELRQRIVRARELLPGVAMPDPMLELITYIAVEFEVCGHRADLAMMNAALAAAALEGKEEVEVEHIKAVAEFALAHRLRKGPFDQEMKDLKRLDHILEKRLAPAPLRIQTGGAGEEMAAAAFPAGGGAEGSRARGGAAAGCPLRRSREAPGGGGGRGPRAQAGAGRVGPGRPGRQRQAHPHHHRHRRGPDGRVPHPARRPRRGGQGHRLRRHHQGGGREGAGRRRSRCRYAGRTCGPRSGSARWATWCCSWWTPARPWAAAAAWTATRQAILALLKDAYQRRDRVGLISFKDDRATLVLNPTSSVQLAGIYLKELSTGGATPLSHGLALGLR